ncbi:MAG: orotate phosphoribosyltransferase [Phycisphaerae bacterium]|nr:orotate phosphoribosyltransferase [Phycisphaerae bacterium]
MTHEQLGQAIKAAAYLEGDFVLRSGRRSRYYLDKYLFETDPQLLRELARHLAKHVTPETTRIAGAELGAVALAAATSLESGKPFVIIRNSRKADYGTGKLIEGRLNSGDQVLLVEDIVTSGGQAVEAVRVLRESGATVQRLVAVIDREEGGAATIQQSGVPFTSLFTSTMLGIGTPK